MFVSIYVCSCVCVYMYVCVCVVCVCTASGYLESLSSEDARCVCALPVVT